MTNLFTNTDLPHSISDGPLSSIIPAYAAFLSQQGYTEDSAHLQLRFLKDMNQWLHQQQLQVTDLSEQVIHLYMRSRHQRFRPRRDDTSTLNRLVYLLRAHGILPKEAARPPNNPHRYIENDYDSYLAKGRGLSEATRINYRSFIKGFYVPLLPKPL